MSGLPTDDELREMLESRASRASADADREAMAGLRAEMRGTPDASGGFAVLPVSVGGRGARLPGSIAAIGLAAVIVVAVVGGRLGASEEGAASGVLDTDVPESIPTLAVSGPDQAAALPAVALPLAWNGARLGQALSDQEIVGEVVVVDGALTTRLCNPGGSCVVDIDRLDGVPIVFPRPPQGDPPLVGPGSGTALRARADGGLDYLGQLDADPQHPLTVEALVHEDTTPGRGLFVVGQLWRRVIDDIGGLSCPATRLPAPGCEPDGTGWVLAGVDSVSGDPSGVTRGLAVTLSDDFDFDSGASTAPSTFLVSSSGDGWQVDGIVAAAIPVSVPPSPSPSASSLPLAPVITLPVLGVPLTFDEIRSWLGRGSLDGRLVVIDGELRLNQRVCGLRVACVGVPTIGGLDGVQIDTDTETQVALQRAIPPPGPFVFVAHDGILRYLGPQPADVDHPITVSQLTDPRIPSLIDPSSPVHELTDGLQLVSGWLVIGGPGPWLTDDMPFDDGTLTSNQGTAVSLMTDPPLDPVDRVVTQGSFLVRDRSRSPAWVETSGPCDASADIVCSAGQASIEIVAILGPTSPLRRPIR